MTPGKRRYKAYFEDPRTYARSEGEWTLPADGVPRAYRVLRSGMEAFDSEVGAESAAAAARRRQKRFTMLASACAALWIWIVL